MVSFPGKPTGSLPATNSVYAIFYHMRDGAPLPHGPHKPAHALRLSSTPAAARRRHLRALSGLESASNYHQAGEAIQKGLTQAGWSTAVLERGLHRVAAARSPHRVVPSPTLNLRSPSLQCATHCCLRRALV